MVVDAVVVASPVVAIVPKSPESVVNIERSDSRASLTLGDRREFARIVFNSAILESVSVCTVKADSLINSSGVEDVVRLMLGDDVTVEPVPWFTELVFEEILDAVLGAELQ